MSKFTSECIAAIDAPFEELVALKNYDPNPNVPAGK